MPMEESTLLSLADEKQRELNIDIGKNELKIKLAEVKEIGCKYAILLQKTAEG